MGMMPPPIPAPTPAHPIDVFGTLLPARQVGGDFYDFFFVGPDTLLLVIADVCDKGVPAALLMALTKSLVRIVSATPRRTAEAAVLPARVLAQVNEELCRDSRDGMFVTAFVGCLDIGARRFSYCNAGHPHPYLSRADGGLAALDAADAFALGLDCDAHYRAATVGFAPGDALLLFTDGVTEAADASGRFFGEARLQAIARSSGERPARETVETVVSALRSFCGDAPQSDDIAAVAVRLAAC